MIRTTEIVTPAPAALLTTVQAVRETLDVDPSVSDSYLARRIGVASEMIALACGRTFGREEVRDTFRDDGSVNLTHDPIRRPPPLILSRNMLTEAPGLVVTWSGSTVDPTLYSLDARAGLLYRLTAAGGVQAWSGSVAVTYWAGWTDEALPAVLEAVCLDLVSADVFGRGRDPAVRSERIENGGEVAYFAPGTASVGDDPRLASFMAAD